MTATGGADMAGWLAANGLTSAQCLRLVGQADAPVTVADPPLGREALWPGVALALARALPQTGPVLARLAEGAQVDLAPDPHRFPRAFTLADDGRGMPFLSCPVQGRLSDVLRLAHEVGHACQYLAAGRADLPPILRETAALLAEGLVCRPEALPQPGLAALAQGRRQRLVARHAGPLRAALRDPSTAHDYGWNYPPAVALAVRVLGDPALCWQVMAGRITPSALLPGP